MLILLKRKKIIFFLLTNITGELTRVYKVATKGEQQGDRWVTGYYLTLSEDGETFLNYKAAQAGFTVNSLLYTETKHTAFHIFIYSLHLEHKGNYDLSRKQSKSSHITYLWFKILS